MADKPKSASEYLAAAKTVSKPRRVAPKPVAAPLVDYGPATKDDKPQSPLNWLMDIVSRPLYGITNVVDKAMDAQDSAEQKWGEGDYLGAVGDKAKSIIGMPMAGLRGVFSTDEDDKAYGSDLIKREGNKRLDKARADEDYIEKYRYDDEAKAALEKGQDRALDIGAGVGGFATDVLLDPLTYIPGAAFLSVGKAIGKGTSALKSGAKEAVASRTAAKVVKDAERAAERAADEAAESVAAPTPPTAESASAAMARKIEETEGPRPVEDPAAEVATITETLGKYSSEEIDSFLSTPKAANIKAKLAEFENTTMAGPKLSASDLKPAAAAVAARAEAKMAAPVPMTKDWVQKVDDLALDLPEQPLVRMGSIDVPLIQATKLALDGDRAAEAAMARFYKDTYIPNHVAAAKTGSYVDELGSPIAKRAEPEEITEAAGITQVQQDADEAAEMVQRWSTDEEFRAELIAERGMDEATLGAELMADAALSAEKAAFAANGASGATEVVVTAVETFRKQLNLDRDELTRVFGKGLVESLWRNSMKAESFDKAVSSLNAILNRTFDYEAVKKLTPVTVRLFKELDMELTRIPLGMHTPKAVPNTAPVGTMDEIMEKIAVEPGPDPITPLQISAARQSLERYAEDIFTAKENFSEVTKGGVHMSGPAEDYGKTVGNRLKETNNYKQVNISSKLIRIFSDEARKFKDGPKGDRYRAFGRGRAHWMRDNVVAAMRVAERALDDKGIPIVLAGADHLDRIPLAQSQILDVLNQFDTKLMDVIYWNTNSSVAPTNFLDAVFVGVSGGSRADIELSIRKTATDHTQHLTAKERKEFTNNIIDPKRTPMGGIIGREKLEGVDLVDELVTLIQKAQPTLAKVAEDNAEAYRARSIGEATEMTDEVLNELEEAFYEGRIADLLRGIDDISTRISKEAHAMGATSVGGDLAKVMATNLIPETDRIVASHAVKGEKLGKAASDEAIKAGKTATATAEHIHRAGVQNQIDEASELIDAGRAVEAEHNAKFLEDGFDSPLDVKRDLGDNNMRALHDTFTKKMVGIVNRSNDLGPLHRSVVEAEGMWRNLVGRVATQLNDLNSANGLGHDKALWQEAFRALQKGVPVENPRIAPHMQKIENLVNQMFGKADDNSLLGSPFFKNNANAEHINKVFAKFEVSKASKLNGGNPAMFDIEKAAAAAKANGTDFRVELASQWKDWDIEDPAEFINKAYTALGKINTDMSVAQVWAKIASETPGAVSSVPKAGYSRIVNDSGKSIMAMYLPTNAWVQDDVLDMLHAADNLMQQTLDLGKGGFARFITDVYKPVQDMWKFGMTIPNPTHHVRNGISDASLTYLAEGMPRTNIYRDAMRVLASHNGYSNFDAIRALNGVQELPKQGAVLIKGRHGELTADGLYTALQNRGNLPNFRTLEQLDDDIIETTSGRIAKSWNSFQHTKGMRAMGGVAEARDHYFRIAHAIQIIEKNKDNPAFKSMDELITFASDRVRKWHPDGSDLTSTEQIFKLIIPFYSWQRKTIPLIAEAMLTQPARVTIFPKASYNLAVAMGIEPESLSDPFPEDQMFPSYMTKRMTGPVYQNAAGDYYGVNPGFASNDVLNEFVGGNPVRSILGSVSPLIRAPFEIATGSQVGTGAQINDMSDYVDGQLPGVGVASRLTGNSVTGSVVSGLQGKGLDEQYQIAAGNKDKQESTTLALLSWLGLGMGTQNMSAPNAQNYAEIEKRNAAALKEDPRSAY